MLAKYFVYTYWCAGLAPLRMVCVVICTASFSHPVYGTLCRSFTHLVYKLQLSMGEYVTTHFVPLSAYDPLTHTLTSIIHGPTGGSYHHTSEYMSKHRIHRAGLKVQSNSNCRPHFPLVSHAGNERIATCQLQWHVFSRRKHMPGHYQARNHLWPTTSI